MKVKNNILNSIPTNNKILIKVRKKDMIGSEHYSRNVRVDYEKCN